jgi:ankyrin repeat protein
MDQASPAPLMAAAARADEAAIRTLLAGGEPVDGGSGGEAGTPLWRVCASQAPAERRIACARLLLEAGASPRETGEGGTTALHQAAWRGPLALLELLIRHGALVWQPDERGKTALDYARAGRAEDRAQIVELLDRPVIRNPRFATAVSAIQTGDLASLNRLLDLHPELLSERAIEPDCYPRDYFRDPKLFWFIANNPTLMRTMPANIVDIAKTMIARGVEQADLDYTLELVMSNGDSNTRRQAALIEALVDAGATATPQSILVTLAHGGFGPVQILLNRSMALTAPIAAALGRDAELASLLAEASPEDRQAAFGIAVINARLAAARLCLEAGADPNQFLPVHRHSTALHQAAINDDVEMLTLLIAHGARADTRDTLWNGTPLGWAVHGRKAKAEAYLRSLEQSAGAS